VFVKVYQRLQAQGYLQAFEQLGGNLLVALERGTRKGFFQDILALTKYLWFENWSALIEFLLDEKKKSAKTIRNTS
jgi:hypothetical protein